MRNIYLLMRNEDSNEIFRLKRKWQIALRRYVIEKKPSKEYARYFGLPIPLFKEWVETQFDSQTHWDNFGEAWQFDHVLPVTYFDFKKESDLMLCWNFCNVGVEKISANKNQASRVDVLSAKTYFENIYKSTGYFMCKQMLDKIVEIETSQLSASAALQAFIITHEKTLTALKGFAQGDFERVNWGLPVEDVIAENLLLGKYGK